MNPKSPNIPVNPMNPKLVGGEPAQFPSLDTAEVAAAAARLVKPTSYRGEEVLAKSREVASMPDSLGSVPPQPQRVKVDPLAPDYDDPMRDFKDVPSSQGDMAAHASQNITTGNAAFVAEQTRQRTAADKQ